MNRSHTPGVNVIDDECDLILLVSIPFLLAISLLAIFGFGTNAVVSSVFAFVGVIPLLMVLSDRLLNADGIRERYVEGELSITEFERAVEHELEEDNGHRSRNSESEQVIIPNREQELDS